jgi:hypothetical protein
VNNLNATSATANERISYFAIPPPVAEGDAAGSLSGSERRTFFRGAIDIRRKKLPMPAQLLRRVRLIVNINRDLFSLFEGGAVGQGIDRCR